ncbi:hypothetical protein GALMADRAFT_147713 [Galerina marginata CBS 339.88]|uniref:Uncharacterized protein n=1 Tax=Galerina marginata (strain CBS 339.88) TaxID=685588 RepID=A0A067S9N5_GALM3|nr:hypothetical protein GALMADRAFT_147713 [Galerina marginata CBS 339.88]
MPGASTPFVRPAARPFNSSSAYFLFWALLYALDAAVAYAGDEIDGCELGIRWSSVIGLGIVDLVASVGADTVFSVFLLNVPMDAALVL